MSEMIVKLIWDGEDLGPYWMNIDNLKMLLYTDTKVKPELLQVEEEYHSDKETPPDWHGEGVA